MPSFGTGAEKKPIIPFKVLGPWQAEFVAYREAKSKKFFNDDGTAKMDAYLDFRITAPKVLAVHPDTPVIKTYFCSAVLGKSRDGKPYKLTEALKAISGIEPTPALIYWELHQKELPAKAELTGEELLKWILSLKGRPVMVLLNEVRGEGDDAKQAVEKVYAIQTTDDGGL